MASFAYPGEALILTLLSNMEARSIVETTYPGGELRWDLLGYTSDRMEYFNVCELSRPDGQDSMKINAASPEGLMVMEGLLMEGILVADGGVVRVNRDRLREAAEEAGTITIGAELVDGGATMAAFHNPSTSIPVKIERSKPTRRFAA